MRARQPNMRKINSFCAGPWRRREWLLLFAFTRHVHAKINYYFEKLAIFAIAL
jgi:hypothetical protein